jgi:hypothetical protein
MNTRLIGALACASVIAMPFGVLAQDRPAKPAARGEGQSGQRSQGGMQGMQGMQGMMDMMNSCPMMSGGRSGAGHSMPALPPGNEKLQLQMHAEIMQRVGEILAKYAAQVK